MASTNNSKKNPIVTIVKVWLVLELLWGTLIGTLAATGFDVLGSAAHAGSASVHLGSVAAFIVGFLVGGFQGMVFTGIAAIACVVFGTIYFVLIKPAVDASKNGGNTKP